MSRGKGSKRLRGWIRFLAGLAGLGLLCGCGGHELPGVIRLADRLKPPGAQVDLGVTATIAGRPFTLQLDRNAFEIGSISLRLAGKAKVAALNWHRSENEENWLAGRRLEFPLDPSGKPQTYEIDLSREPQWAGNISALRVSAQGGEVALLGLTLHPLRSASRSISLHGVTIPSLIGQERIEIPFDGDLPRRARFEASIGLLPEFEAMGATSCFTLSIKSGAEEHSMFHRCLDPADSRGWIPVARDIELPRRGSLVLEAKAKLGNRELMAGAARWGDPLLVNPRPDAKPNLVLVVIDTLRADALGSYGNRDGLTPNLDALAARSVRLAELRSPAPWTLPSVSTLITGLQPATHGAGRRFGADAPMGLPDGFTTLAQTLAANGFYTSGVYKNIYVNPEFGLHRGFDRYASHDDMPQPLGQSGPPLESNAGFLVDRAIDELQRIKDRRFFLYVHLFDPHNPYEAPLEWCDRVAKRLEPGYAGNLGCRVDRRPEDPMPPESDFRWIRALYDTEVAYTDHEVGRLFAELQRQGLEDSTVLAVVSDHGEEFYERLGQEQRLLYDANSDHGHTLYDELLHVPAILRIPGVAPRVVADPVQIADLYPTLLDTLGVANPLQDMPGVDGQDLLPTLQGNAHPRPVPMLADVILHGPPRVAIRRGPWKLITSRRRELSSELYDLEHDPGETRDVFAQHPDVVQGLFGLLGQAQKSRDELRQRLLGENGLRATAVEWSHIAKLRALGYLH